MLMKKMQKLIAAFVLVGFVGSAGLPIVAEASFHNYREEQRIEHHREKQRIAEHHREEQRIAEHRREEQRRHDHRAEYRRYNDNESHSDEGNLVTGLLIGGIVGAIIGNN